MHIYTHMHSCSVFKSSPTLCDPIDWSPTGSTVHGISQVRILEPVTISSCRASPALAGRFFITKSFSHGAIYIYKDM